MSKDNNMSRGKAATIFREDIGMKKRKINTTTERDTRSPNQIEKDKLARRKPSGYKYFSKEDLKMIEDADMDREINAIIAAQERTEEEAKLDKWRITDDRRQKEIRDKVKLTSDNSFEAPSENFAIRYLNPNLSDYDIEDEIVLDRNSNIRDTGKILGYIPYLNISQLFPQHSIEKIGNKSNIRRAKQDLPNYDTEEKIVLDRNSNIRDTGKKLERPSVRNVHLVVQQGAQPLHPQLRSQYSNAPTDNISNIKRAKKYAHGGSVTMDDLYDALAHTISPYPYSPQPFFSNTSPPRRVPNARDVFVADYLRQGLGAKDRARKYFR